MEYIDVIDQLDNVVGRVAFDEIYEKKLPHRIVHVLVFDRKGRMAIQLRSFKKSFCPNHWSTTVGGHVQSGESYKKAALREFREELGKKPKIEFVSKNWYEAGGLKKSIAVFKAIYEGGFVVNLEEVQKVSYFTASEIERMVNDGEKFHPELLFILKLEDLKKIGFGS